MSGHYPLPEQWSPPGQTVHTQPQPSLDVGQYTLYQVDSAIQAPFESPTPSPSFYQPHPSFAHSTLPASPTTSDQSPASYSAPPMQFWSPRPSHSIDHQGSPALGYVEIRPKPEHSDAANAPVIYRREYEQTRMEVGDEMPSAVLASDFVRKLYKSVPPVTFLVVVTYFVIRCRRLSLTLLTFERRVVAYCKTVRCRTSSLGVPQATSSLSRTSTSSR